MYSLNIDLHKYSNLPNKRFVPFIYSCKYKLLENSVLDTKNKIFYIKDLFCIFFAIFFLFLYLHFLIFSLFL